MKAHTLNLPEDFLPTEELAQLTEWEQGFVEGFCAGQGFSHPSEEQFKLAFDAMIDSYVKRGIVRADRG